MYDCVQMKVKTLGALLTALTMLLLALTTLPADAAKLGRYDVRVTTTAAVATGTLYQDTVTGSWVVHRPTFAISMKVRCPRRSSGAHIRVSPVAGHTNPGADVACSGRPVRMTFRSAGAPPRLGVHNVVVGVSLYVGGKVRARDYQRVQVRVQARPQPPKAQSIDITTRTATAVGDTLDDTPNFVFRPTYTLSADVVCAKGDDGFMRVPVWAMSAPGASFTCTGSTQTVSFAGTAAPTTPGTATVPVTATLMTPRGEVSDTESITITTTSR